MSKTILEISPEDFTPLFGAEFGDRFLLITSPNIRSSFRLVPWSENNCTVIEFVWLGSQSRQNLVAQLRQFQQENLYCSAIWITTDEYEHFSVSELKNIKFAAISFFSSSFSVKNLRKIVEITKKTDYQLQLKTESRMLDLLDSSQHMVFRCQQYKTEAVFNHLETEHWFSLHGSLEFGQQTVLPTGELSVLADPSGQFNEKSRFLLEGDLLLEGVPIVHRSHAEVSLSETLEQYKKLASMIKFPAIAKVCNGEIQDLYSPVEDRNPFLIELEKLFSTDSNFCKIHEIGFGTNSYCTLLTGNNFLPNERYPSVHFGLGLGGITRFHIDLVCKKITTLVAVDQNGFQKLYS